MGKTTACNVSIQYLESVHVLAVSLPIHLPANDLEKKKVESGSGVWASATHVDLAEAFGSQLQPDPVLARTAWKGRSKWKILLSITLPFKANK